jgi:hypothetical protein
MPAVTVRENIWKDLLAVAEKQRQKPESLANQALKDFLERVSDEELLKRSTTAARRSPLRISQTEEVIHRYRRKR